MARQLGGRQSRTAGTIAAHETGLRANFKAFGEARDDGVNFPQPIRVNVLRKR